MFASEPQSLEDSSTQEPVPQEMETPTQPTGSSSLPTDAQQVLNILGTQGDLQGFTDAYINLLKGDSSNLTGFLNEHFKSQDSNIFEFLFNLFKANSKDEWGIKSFYTTIMNLGLVIKDQGTPNIYYYLLLTTKDQPSPIYGLVQELNQNDPSDEINNHFIRSWNRLFGIKEPEPKKSKSNSKSLSGIEKFTNISKNSRYTIMFTVVLLVVILMGCAGFFINKYKGTVPISMPKIEIPKVPKVPMAAATITPKLVF